MIALRLLTYVVVVIVSAMLEAAIREWLGTEIKHRSIGRGITYNVISFLFTVLAWEVLTWALHGNPDG